MPHAFRLPWVCLTLVMLGCDSGPALKPLDRPQARPLAPPPDPDSAPATIDEMLLSTQKSLNEGDRTTAYHTLKACLDRLPPQDPRRPDIEQQVGRLAFLLGLPAPEVDTVAGAVVLEPGRKASVDAAQVLFNEGEALLKQDKRQEALLKYQEVLKTITDQDAPALYWLTWQKVEDLSPEGGGPSTLVERAEAAADNDEGESEGIPLGGGITSPVVTQAERMKQARESFLRGVAYERAANVDKAREAFQLVISNVPEGADPQLVDAARKHLQQLDHIEDADLERSIRAHVDSLIK